MRIYISSPGQFYEGFNSRLRGEGRWLIHLAAVLNNQGHSVTIFSNDPVSTYQHNGVEFTSVWNNEYPPECDLMISMDSFSDFPELHKTNVSPQLDRFKPTKRIWATVFPVDDSHPIHDTVPVIYMYNYPRSKGTCLPIISHTKLTPPDFERTHVHWYSKNSHEEPQYILGAVKGLHKLVTAYGATCTVIDGPQIQNGQYRKNYPPEKEAECKRLFSEVIDKGNDSFSNWVPYDYVRGLLAKTKLLLGVHHPVLPPSSLEIAALGGFPIIFENQKKCEGYPYEKIDIPFVPESATDDDVLALIETLWSDKTLFTESVLKCQEAIFPHSYAEVSKKVEQFMRKL